MNCEKAREKLWGLAEGSLSARVRKRVEAHAAECEGCRAELEALWNLDEALSGEPRVEPPEGMARAIVRRATARAMMRRRVMVPGWLEALSFVGVGWAAAAVGLIGLRLVMAVGQIEVPIGSAVGVVSVVVAAGLAVFGAAYYRA